MLFVFLAWSVRALACPMCVPAGEAVRQAFLWTAILMTLLPLGLVGGAIFWIWRRTRSGPRRGPTASSS